MGSDLQTAHPPPLAGTLRRMPAHQRLLLSNHQDKRTVHSERRDRRTFRARQTDDGGAFPTEVRSPALTPGVKQCDGASAYRVGCGAPGPFLERAGNTRQREVVRARRSATRLRYDVVDMKGGFLTFLSKPAVLAASFGSRCDQPSQARRNRPRKSHADR
jgi:hypothetical protein